MEQLVPKDHLLRKVNAALDFDFIYELVKDKYSEVTGRPSIDPVVLIKIVMIQYLFGIRSMRQTVKDIGVNAAYRWFFGMGWQDSVPHFTTFGKNYSRRFAGTDLFERIFAHILEECYEQGFVRDEAVFVDAMHIKASANRNKKIKVQAESEAAHCAAELAAEIPAVPYTRPKTKDGYFSKQNYRYEHSLDCYICPGGDILTYSTINREGYREYKSKGKYCKDCPCLHQCTHSKNHVKTITRHVWQAYVDTAENLRRDKDVHAIYKKRKETIERVFADAKEKHGMRYTQLRGHAKVKMQAGLTFACMNLKKLAVWSWNGPRKQPLSDHIFIFRLLFHKNRVQAMMCTPSRGQ